ncbi:MAG: AarF/ABC1/UbiB kinase family protein [Chloroflexi bacterium]|nr:AarF/ABC1/UbiB kinase family protein [Chloroflexota bacterium]
MPLNNNNPAATIENGGFEILKEHKQGFVRRFFIAGRHFMGLVVGSGYAFVRRQKKRGHGRHLSILILRLLLSLLWPFVNRDLVKRPFPEQFRRRLEMLGPTYIKLGQILSLREDLLPKDITDELKNLLDKLPIVTFVRYQELLGKSLQRPVSSMFSYIAPLPLGSASLAQTHRARLITGEEVVIKLIKPGVRQAVINDTRLLRLFGAILQLFIARYQPRRLVSEFCRYTLLEVDLHNEAANAEIFAANFRDQSRIHFPIIYREFSSRDVLCMEFFDGRKPTADLLDDMGRSQLDAIIDLGVSATIQMIFRDGFFHADLHPGNLIIFEDDSVGFIDLGMVGRFDQDMRTRMLYYLYSLVMGDAYNAARYLTAMTIARRGSDPDGFRRAVEDLNRRWLRAPNFNEFSLGQLILHSIQMAARYHIQYPGEIILMVKALITLEGVGNVLAPGIDVADVARKHVRQIMLNKYSISKIVKDSLLVLPELLDIFVTSPLVINEGLRFLENQMKSSREGPLAELRGTLFAGFLVLAGGLVAAAEGSIWLWGFLFISAFTIAGYGIFARRS